MDIIMVPNKMSGEQWHMRVMAIAIACKLELVKLRWLTQKESCSEERHMYRRATKLAQCLPGNPRGCKGLTDLC